MRLPSTSAESLSNEHTLEGQAGDIPNQGIIALQIHGNAVSEERFKEIDSEVRETADQSHQPLLE